ncbi:ATP-binding protein [Palleronia sp. LCG004]|uniref:ATP-binding protein n=1 Tax=Palleronia sp. LCG004 TaxID=3079304 RepID=UPI0029423FA5|nr:ATP-binding protein [Palleronia sp. LCG004]WOI57437.1 ATP-binding protein [Palleronia sp. LCG004]
MIAFATAHWACTLVTLASIALLAALVVHGRAHRRRVAALTHELAEAQRIARMGTVRWDFSRDKVVWSDEYARLFGLAPGGVMNGTEFAALVAPGDLDRIVESERRALDESARTGAPVRREISFGMRRTDGTFVEVESLSELRADMDGHPVSMISTVRDITETACAKRRLKESERHLAAAQRVARLGSFRLTVASETVEWSKELYDLLGRDPEAGPAPLPELLPDEEERAQLEAKLQVIYEPHAPLEKRLATVDFRMRHADGAYRHVRAAMEMSYDDRGEAEILTGVIRDVTDEVRREADLREAVAAAERANAAKSEFLAVISHELRTPMNGVIGMLGALDDAAFGCEQRDQLRIARASADTLLVILNDILDASKIEAGKLEVEVAPFDLPSLIQSVVDLYAQKACEKGIRLDGAVDRDVPTWITADSGRIRQVLSNLVSNAVKFTPDGRVVIRVSRISKEPNAAPSLRFAVEDSGLGIPKANHHKVFGRYDQLDASYTRRFGGTGLGLSICRSLAELMGGEMGFSSAEGAGSTFWMDIPVQPAEPRVDAPGKDVPNILKPMRILVAEDNPTNQIVARAMLQALGQKVDFVANGKEAVEAAERFDYDLIFMDLSMPVMDGFEAARAIRAGSARHTPIVALTANATQTEREACLAVGISNILIKPVTRPQLAASLADPLGLGAHNSDPDRTDLHRRKGETA